MGTLVDASPLLIVCIFLLCRSVFIDAEVEDKVTKYQWTIDYELWSPDCVEKVVIGINGQFPGPTVRGRVGETLEIEVVNMLPTESVSIHWHGVRQNGTPWADGTAFVSQCPVNSGESFTYKFVLDKAGTYSYYGLNGMQRSAGLYGLLIVDVAKGEKEPFGYDDELSVLVSDWWHKSPNEQFLGLSLPVPQFRWVGEPQSLLINGRGRYNCALVPKGRADSGDTVTCNANSPQCSPFVMSVERSKTYRLRIASVASLSSLNFLIERHNLVVVEADGRYVEPVTVESLDVYAGESYSVLLNTSQFPGRNYWAALNVRGRQPRTPTGVAILNYFPNSPSTLPFGSPPPGPLWNDTAFSIAQSNLYKARHGFVPSVPSLAHNQILLLNTQTLVNSRIRWSLNNLSLSLALPPTPYLSAIAYDLPHSFDRHQPPATFDLERYNINLAPTNPNSTLSSRAYRIPFWHTIDIILQNANTLFPKNSEIHPWHLHGHDFWVVGRGTGKFDPDNDPKSYNLVNPPMRNTATLFPYGWVALRFKADNPGAWLLHCMIEPHFVLGMGIILSESVDWVEEVPASTMGCGQTKELLDDLF